MFKKIMFYSLKLLLQCIVVSTIFYFISFYFARNSKFSQNPFAIMQGFGIITVLLGAMGFTRGNATGVGVSSMGSLFATQQTFFNMEVTQYERKLFPYHEIFSKNNIVKMDFGALSMVIIGIFTFAAGYLIDKL